MEKRPMDKIKSRTEIESKWRDRLFMTCCLLAVIILAVDVAFYFYNKSHNLLYMSEASSRVRFIYIPTIVNAVLIIITFFINRSRACSDRIKNAFVSALLTLICTTVMLTHYMYTPLLCVPAIGILVSTLFGDRVLTLILTTVSLFSVGAMYFIASGEFRRGDPQLLGDAGIAWIVLACCQVAGNVIIDYNEERIRYISETYHREKELEERIKVDPLMDINNRVTLEPTLSAKIRAYDPAHPMSLLMMDIDDFKQVNDKYGHISGDEVLVKLAEIIKSHEGPGITPYRYGGEELLILMEDMNKDAAKELADKILAQTREQTYTFDPDLRVTFSGGIKEFEPGIVAGQWISLADAAMYMAKKSGKNHVEILG